MVKSNKLKFKQFLRQLWFWKNSIKQLKLKHFKNAIELTRKFTDISKEHKHHKTLLLFSPNLQWKSMDQKCQDSAFDVPMVFWC